jgi:hypothetical protein
MSSLNSFLSASHERARRHNLYDNVDFSTQRYSLPAINKDTPLIMAHSFTD